jgi:hypothetical protein
MTNMRIYWQSNALNHNISFMFCRKLWQVEYTYGYLHLLFTFFRAHSLNTVCLSKWKYRSIYRSRTFFAFLTVGHFILSSRNTVYTKTRNYFLLIFQWVVCIETLRTCQEVLFWKRFDDWIVTFCPIIYYMAKKSCSNKLWCIRWRVRAL